VAFSGDRHSPVCIAAYIHLIMSGSGSGRLSGHCTRFEVEILSSSLCQGAAWELRACLVLPGDQKVARAEH
jgi:hypothetical protein